MSLAEIRHEYLRRADPPAWALYLFTVTEFVTLLENNAAAFNAAGFAVTMIVTDLNTKKTTLVNRNDLQESLRTSCKNATAEAVAASSLLYETFSNRIDGATAAVGKKTHLGQQILRLRTTLRRNGRSLNGNGHAEVDGNGNGAGASAPSGSSSSASSQ